MKESTMKKILVVALVFILAAGVALPWVNGMVMDKLAHDSLSNLNRLSGDTGLKYEILEYQRGYKSTRALWKVTGPGGNQVMFTETATHGWTQVLSDTRLEKNPWYANWVKGRKKDPLVIQTRYSVFGPIVTQIILDPVSVPGQDRAVRIGALDLTVSMDKALSTVSSFGTWDGVSSDDGNNRIGRMTIQSEMEKVSGPVWQGAATVAVKGLAVKGSRKSLTLSNLVVKTDTMADKAAGQMDMSVSVNADQIQVTGQSLSDWALGLSLEKVDIQAVAELSRFYRNMAGQMAQVLYDPDLSSHQRGLALRPLKVESRMALIAQLEKMLNKGFGLDISPVDITLPQGRIQGHLFIGLLKDMTLAGFFPLAVRPDLALDIFFLDSEVRVPKEFAQMQPSLTVPLFSGMQTGLFVREGDCLHHRAQTRDQALFLNGKTVEF